MTFHQGVSMLGHEGAYRGEVEAAEVDAITRAVKPQRDGPAVETGRHVQS